MRREYLGSEGRALPQVVYPLEPEVLYLPTLLTLLGNLSREAYRVIHACLAFLISFLDIAILTRVR